MKTFWIVLESDDSVDDVCPPDEKKNKADKQQALWKEPGMKKV